MKYPVYSEYKDSGVEWLGDVPEQWGLKKIKYLFQIRKRISGEIGHDVLSITQQGIKIKDIESGEGQLSMDYSKYQFVEVDDFAMNHMDLLTGFVDISKFHGVTSPDYRVFSLTENHATPQYYLYLLQMGYWGKIFYSHGQGSSQLGRWRFPTEKFKSFAFPFPSQEEQTTIANFLDRETTKIDILINKQQKLISLLQEKRQAVISHAVTKGINPDVKMKDSGVEWLGETPEHWFMIKFGITNESTVLGGNYSGGEGEDGLPLIKMGNLGRGKLIFNKLEHLSITDVYEKIHLLSEDDFLFNTRNSMDLVGKVAIWGGELPKALYNSNILKIVFYEKFVSSTAFMSYLFNSDLMLSQLRSIAKGTTNVAAIYYKDLKSIIIPMPTRKDQIQISEYLDHETEKIDALIGKTYIAIALLQERRTALISAAVTGKIDVRNA